MWRWLRTCVAMCTAVFAAATLLVAQDGASSNTKAKEYRAPANSLSGAPENPARTSAIGLLLSGEVDRAIAALTGLAEGGDAPSALFLAGFYREKSWISFPVDPVKALHLYALASREGSGEGSERVAEMVERQEVAAPAEGGAEYWRALARRQGWQQQRLATFCFDWAHGPEELHCNAVSLPGMKQLLPECPDEEAMRRLRAGGVTGAIRLSTGQRPDAPGSQATTIVLVDHVVPDEVDLQEPDAGTVIYVQRTNDLWRMLPAEAPLLPRYLILAPKTYDARRMSLMSQAVDGAQQGSDCGSFVPMTREEGERFSLPH